MKKRIFSRGQVKAQQAPKSTRHPRGDVAQQILGLDNINTSVACQSQGFLLRTFFIFILLSLFTKNPQGFTLLISESYPL